jgi:hypothetical protein
MKSILKLSLALSIMVVVQSCDKVDGPYKKDIVAPTGERKVMVEDYTGHKCGNCPRAAKALYDLKSVYGDKLVIIGVHAGTFATPFPPAAGIFTYDFRNPVSMELDTDFGISLAGNPNGMVNRRVVNGSHIISSTKWSSEIATVLSSPEPVPLNISINNSFNNNTRTLSADVTTEFYSTLNGTHKLCVYLVEDSIINWQKDYDATPNDIPDYVHREVLRGSMNGTYGDVVVNTNGGTSSTLSYSSVLDVEWKEEHFSIVAFLYNEATKEILQVEQVHVTP